jgi:hypothetical protein
LSGEFFCETVLGISIFVENWLQQCVCPTNQPKYYLSNFRNRAPSNDRFIPSLDRQNVSGGASTERIALMPEAFHAGGSCIIFGMLASAAPKACVMLLLVQ